MSLSPALPNLPRSFALLVLAALSGLGLAQNPMTSYCGPAQFGVIPCPCGNPPSGLNKGCDNSSTTGGAILSATGYAALIGDTLVFTTLAEKPTATSIVLQGTASNGGGLVFGQGVRCVAGTLKRLYVKTASGGSITAPTGADLSVSARSAALGDPLSAGMTRYYSVYYRDPIVLGGCPATSTFNVTQSGSIVWSNTIPVPTMVPIPAGSFAMGSNAAPNAPYFGTPATQPVHQVTISYPFWMGETEVTQSEYQALTGATPSFVIGPNHPVEGVNWYQAQAYCAALTAQQAALGNVPAGYQYRLPTEAEWEYACRAGTTSEFNVGDSLLCSNAKFMYSYHSGTSCSQTFSMPVKSYAPNAFGLYDMHGNVWELCLDVYAPYTPGAATDPFVGGGPDSVVRGGGWDSNSNSLRSAHRVSAYLGASGYNLGFRVVLGPILVP